MRYEELFAMYSVQSAGNLYKSQGHMNHSLRIQSPCPQCMQVAHYLHKEVDPSVPSVDSIPDKIVHLSIVLIPTCAG